MRNIYDLTLNELEDYFISIGEKKFRATQIYEGLYKKRYNSFDEAVVQTISKGSQDNNLQQRMVVLCHHDDHLSDTVYAIRKQSFFGK